MRIQLGSNVTGHSADDSCLGYNNYTVAANATTCALPAYPPPAGAQNNGNAIGYTYVDSVNSTLSHTTSHTYDSLNRLAGAVAKNLSLNTLWTQTYNDDRYGNMACAAGSSGVCNTAVSFPANDGSTNNHITTTGYNYDAAGNL